MARKTPWFSFDVKPVHVGVYQTLLMDGEPFFGFSRWDGFVWMDTGRSVENANGCEMVGEQKKCWRGLTEKQS